MAKLEKTSVPGIFRRHRQSCEGGRCECKYVVIWRDRGKQHKKTFRTLTEARDGKRKLEQAVADGTSVGHSRILLHDYVLDWIERYQGSGKRGYRESTREQDRSLLKRYALKYFPKQIKLQEVQPADINKFVNWLAKQPARPKSKRRKGEPVKTLSDSSVRNALVPLRSCFATARREGLILHNPATDAVLPHRPRIIEDEDLAQPFPGKTMELVVQLVNPKYRLMFELLAETGIRRSELIALQGKHLKLDGDKPEIQVRQALRREKGKLVLVPPKSKESRREVPISTDLADKLKALHRLDKEPAFPNEAGNYFDPDNLFNRALKPAMAEAGFDSGGFHQFRHTVASRLFAEGRNIVQVQHWLGHSDPAFTLKRYVHLLDNDLGGPIKPLGDDAEGNEKATDCRIESDIHVLTEATETP
ncbi:MAG: site-specific integrase [Solirubrobacterales bacterium]|nr:site-specific integrase [Solirubrobacterales bacterium]